jgi:hypothetical protein
MATASSTTVTFANFDAVLKVSAPMRECASSKCPIIRYYAETATVHVVGEDEQKQWYQIKAKDDDGAPLAGWMTKQAFAAIPSSSKSKPLPVNSTANNNQASLAVSSAADIAEVTGAIDFVISKYQGIKSASAMLANRVRTDVAQAGQFLPQLITLGNQVLAAINSFDAAIDSSISLLKTQKNQALSSGYVDRDFWLNTRMPQIVAEQNNYWKDLTAILNIYKAGSTEAVQSFVAKTVTTQNSQLQQYTEQLRQQNKTLYKPCSDWNAQVSVNEQAFRTEVANVGGFTTDSQARAIAIQRAGNPPAQCGGYSTGSASSYSSTRCNYLNGGLDCYGPNGTRTQVNSSGSGFDVSQW